MYATGLIKSGLIQFLYWPDAGFLNYCFIFALRQQEHIV